MEILQHMISAQMAAVQGQPFNHMIVENDLKPIMGAQIYKEAFIVGRTYGDSIRVILRTKNPIFTIGSGERPVILKKDDFDELRTRPPDLSKLYDVSARIKEFVYFGDDHDYANDVLYGPFLHTPRWKGSDVFVYAHVWKRDETYGINYSLCPFELDVARETPQDIVEAASALLPNVTVWRRYVMVPSDASPN